MRGATERHEREPCPSQNKRSKRMFPGEHAIVPKPAFIDPPPPLAHIVDPCQDAAGRREADIRRQASERPRPRPTRNTPPSSALCLLHINSMKNLQGSGSA